MKKLVFILMILAIFSKMLGFGREITLSYFYGASNVTDAYLISLTIPLILFQFFAKSIQHTYIPMYSRILKEKGIKDAIGFTNMLINVVLVICTFIVVIVIVFTVPIVKMFASGFQEETLILATNLTRISIFAIYFSGLVYIFTGYLHLNNNFKVPSLMSLPFNLAIILSIFLAYRFNNIILGIGSVVAGLLQILWLMPFVLKQGYRFSFVLNKYKEQFKKIIYLSLPVMIGVSANQINVLVDRTIASQISIGGISALTYANLFNLFIQGVFVASITTVIFPMISKMVVENNLSGLKKSISTIFNSINLLLIPAVVGVMIFAELIVQVVFGRGAFDSQAVSMTSTALFYYSIGMVGYGLRDVLSKVFFSMEDTKTPMINAAIGMGLNIILNIILSKFLGIGGLALATSISATFTTILLTISLRRKIGQFGLKHISVSFVKILIASLLTGVISKLSFDYLSIHIFNQFLLFLLTLAIGVTTYVVIIYFIKIDDVNIFVNVIKRKIKSVLK
ncbi:murein biosynthesis integral membrane protein MurJ [Chengkuizengella sp. SCS-71B]|uniref:murein biosynthesis integral membrane protein MurJ n=1 Tax=Chengkuizengella sp. SCS-71B TaxID=3115290 RepID=UPI0032C21454